MEPRFSFFGFSKDVEAISAAGYDCIEMHMREIMSLEESAFNLLLQKLNQTVLACEVLDNPVPLDQSIANDSFDLDYYEKYLTFGAARAARLGVKYFIYGNGFTRSLPKEGDLENARQKSLRFMRLLADITAEQDITILIEPLAPTVSNIIHSIPEAVAYVQSVNRPNLGTFLDYRWFLDRQHPYVMIEEYASHIKHIHIDNPEHPFPTRLVPKLDDGHNYDKFFETLNKINYGGIISIEANTFKDYQQDLLDGLNFLKVMCSESNP